MRVRCCDADLAVIVGRTSDRFVDGCVVGELEWPGFTSVWAGVPPHGHETVTGPFQVGVAFSAHRDVHYRSVAHAARTSYGGGAVVCSGVDSIVWSDVRDPTDALEIYPSMALLHSVVETAAVPGWPVEQAAVGIVDPVVVAVAGILRRAHVAGAYVGETASSGLGYLLARHILVEYAGVRVPPAAGHTRPNRATVRRVTDLVADDLAGPLTLDRLAAEAHLSPYIFARSFTATLGQPPYEYVTARRMDRARSLLANAPGSVSEVAAAVGFANLSHFRRVFRAHTGVSPPAYRDQVA